MADSESKVCYNSELTSEVEFRIPCDPFPFDEVEERDQYDDRQEIEWTVIDGFELSMKTKFEMTFPINLIINMETDINKGKGRRLIKRGELKVFIDFKENYFREIKNVDLKLVFTAVVL